MDEFTPPTMTSGEAIHEFIGALLHIALMLMTAYMMVYYFTDFGTVLFVAGLGFVALLQSIYVLINDLRNPNKEIVDATQD